MSYVMFVTLQIICGLIVYFTFRGALPLSLAICGVIVALAHSAYQFGKKPDATGSRMASFTAALWLVSIFAAHLAIELRTFGITIAAAIIGFIFAGLAGSSTWVLARDSGQFVFDND